jgi:D-glycero-beta-D-manno-heptose-7-phosphate kinase
VITEAVIDAVRHHHALTTVDSQGSLRDFAGLDLIKCNQAEAENVLGTSLSNTAIRERLLTQLQQELSTDRLVITLGAEGAAISSKSVGYRELPPIDRQQVFDVTGAGDTVIAMLTAGLVAGGTDLEALHLSQIAAGLVIARWGNAQASLDELLDELDHDGDAGAL